jgi:hypothetical protein
VPADSEGGGNVGRPPVATLRVVSPCEHGVTHHIKELLDGAVFSVPECKDSRGKQRLHTADEATYPNTVRRT